MTNSTKKVTQSQIINLELITYMYVDTCMTEKLLHGRRLYRPHKSSRHMLLIFFHKLKNIMLTCKMKKPAQLAQLDMR